jgi:hypothetical protein
MGDTASDEMIDIQIEESLVWETLVTINSANYREDMLPLGGFFAILILTALTGIFGPPSVVVQALDREIGNRSMIEPINFVASEISSFNRFVSLSLKLTQLEPCTATQLRPAFSCDTEWKRERITVHTESHRFESIQIGFPKCSATIQLFFRSIAEL